LKENSLLILNMISANIDDNSKYFPFISGTKLKKVRCLMTKGESKASVEEFDTALKTFTLQIIGEVNKRKTECLSKSDLQNYLRHFNMIQNLMRECQAYSRWSPKGYRGIENIQEFDHLWKDVTEKELPELPKFYNAIISYIELNMGDKSDSEKDKHLSCLIKIYIFLSPAQKQTFLSEFSLDLAKTFENFTENYLTMSKENTNLLVK